MFSNAKITVCLLLNTNKTAENFGHSNKHFCAGKLLQLPKIQLKKQQNLEIYMRSNMQMIRINYKHSKQQQQKQQRQQQWPQCFKVCVKRYVNLFIIYRNKKREREKIETKCLFIVQQFCVVAR